MKGFAAAQRHKGGFDQWVHDEFKNVYTSIGGDTTDITAIKEAIGKAEGTGAGGILKDIKDIKDAIGADDTTSGGLKKRCKDIETAIGDEDTSGTILYRIKQLESSGG